MAETARVRFKQALADVLHDLKNKQPRKLIISKMMWNTRVEGTSDTGLGSCRFFVDNFVYYSISFKGEREPACASEFALVIAPSGSCRISLLILGGLG